MESNKTFRLCLSCGVIKDIKERFYKNKRQCRNCYCKQQYAKNRESRIAQMKTYRENNKEYFKEYNRKHKKEIRLWYEQNKERTLKESKEKYAKPETKERIRLYREKNKERIKKRKREYRQRPETKELVKKYKNTLRVKIAHKMAHRIRYHLRTYNIPKRYNTIDYLGCDIPFYLKFLEEQFTLEMNWDNYGTYWHIDHIIPLVLFNVDNREDLFVGCNYKNTRPFPAKENMTRSKYTIKKEELALVLSRGLQLSESKIKELEGKLI